MLKWINQIKLKLFPPKEPPVDLGNKVAFFQLRKNGIKHRISLGLSILLIAIILVFFLLKGVIALIKIQNYGRSVVVQQFSGFPPIFYFLIIIAVLSFLLSIYFNKIGVHIFKDGILIDNLFQKRAVVWEDIIEFDSRIVNSKFGDSIISSNVKIRMRNKDKRQINIRNEFDQMEKFIQKLREGIIPILFRNAYSNLAHGKTLKFHDNLLIIKTGVEIKDHFYTWSEVTKAQTNHGMLELWTTLNPETPAIFPIDEITNLDLLPYLINNPPKRNH